MRRAERWCAAGVGAALALTASGAWAQEGTEYIPEKGAEETVKDKQGWDATLAVGAQASFASNESVIGQPDGTSYTLGFNVTGGLQYIKGGHESRNTLNISETFTRTPIVAEFARTTDLVELESIYYYHFEKWEWIGPFVRFKLQTSIFKGEDIQPAEKDYLVTKIDDTQETITTSRFALTDPFFPLTLKESAGVFIRPINRDWLRAELRTGLGAREVFAGDQFALKDNADTPEIEVAELESFQQIGAEVVGQVQGKILSDRIIYSAGAELLTPFYDSSSETEKSLTELTNIELYAKVSLRLVSWASLDYEYRAVRQPALLDKFQIQNNLLFTIGYTLLEED